MSQKIFADLFEELGLGMFRASPDGELLEANQGLADLLGYSSPGWVIRRGSKALFAEPGAYEQMIALLEQEGKVIDYHMQANCKGGKRLWVSVDMFQQQGEDGETAYLGTVRDVTTQVRIQEEGKERTQDYLDIAGVIIVIINADETIQLLNKKGCEVLNCKGNSIGRNWFDTFVPERDRERTREAFRQLVAGNIEAAAQFENYVQTTDGELRLIAWQNVFLRDEHGKITCTLSSGEDITEKRQMQDELLHKEAMYRDLFEGAANPIFIFDQGLKVLMANKSGAVNFRLPVEKVVGRPVRELSPDLYDLLSYRVKGVLETGRTLEFEDRIELPVGEKWWWTVMRPVRMQGTEAVQVIAYDLTGWKMAERALMESEERFRQIVEDQTEFIVRWRPGDGVRTFVNQSYARYVGKRPEELIGLSFYDMVTDEERERVKGKVAALSRETPIVTELHLASMPDGTVRWQQWIDRAIFDAEGQVVEIQSVGRDMHERKMMEEELRKGEERYRAIVEDQMDLIVRWTMDGTCTFVNSSFCRHFGVEADEFIGMNRFMYESEEDIAYIKDIVSELTPKYPSMTYEIKVDLPAGFSRWYQWTDRAIFDQGGGVMEVQSVGQDITNRKLVEEQLNTQNSALKAAENGIAIMDAAGKVVWVNPAFTRMTGYTSREALGKPMGMFIAGGAEDTVFEEILAAVSAGKSWRGEVVSRRKDGSEYYEQKTISPVRDALGQVANFVEVKQDVTERHEAEERLRRYANWLEVIRAVNQAAMEFKTVDEIAALALKGMGNVFPFDRASLTWFDLKAGEMVVGAAAGEGSKKLKQGTRIAMGSLFDKLDILRRGEMVSVPDIEALEVHSSIEEMFLKAGLKSYVLVPISFSRDLRGTLNVASKTQAAYGKEELAILEDLTLAFTSPLENAWLFDQVSAGRERLQQLNKRLVDVQETERRALAQELHDEVGQILTGLKLTLASGLRAKDSEAQQGFMKSAAEMIDDLIGEVQELSLSLRPNMLDDHGLLPALLWLLDRYQSQTGIAVDFKHQGIEGERLSAEIETAVYRIVQEALTNVARHAGVSEVQVRVLYVEGVVTLRVEDQGAGIQPELLDEMSRSMGMMGMQERAGILGGQFTLESEPGEGTMVLVQLPVWGKINRRRRLR